MTTFCVVLYKSYKANDLLRRQHRAALVVMANRNATLDAKYRETCEKLRRQEQEGQLSKVRLKEAEQQIVQVCGLCIH